MTNVDRNKMKNIDNVTRLTIVGFAGSFFQLFVLFIISRYEKSEFPNFGLILGWGIASIISLNLYFKVFTNKIT